LGAKTTGELRLQEGKAPGFSALRGDIRRFGRLRRQFCSNFVVMEAAKADHDLYHPIHPWNVGLSLPEKELNRIHRSFNFARWEQVTR
jgi:hypothetical protein